VELDPNSAILALVTLPVGYLMVSAGIQKSMLEWRRTARLCPSCGRAITSRVCRVCSS
jgi:recombinational DNA repair protein RecR